MILGSAPEYPHGLIDPIEAMGQIAQRHGVPLHVDACVGGFILPFMAMNGIALPLWDYRVPGVTSISADIHKYGFAAKGASVILYRSKDLRRWTFSGGPWTSQTLKVTSRCTARTCRCFACCACVLGAYRH
jgi:glutamate/tyrosine decarboxylase-like PLP-dependent enzyme